MGKIITISTSVVKPTQGDLYKDRLSRAYNYYKKGGFPTPPIVREHQGDFFQIDGNHRLTITDLFGESVKVYVPEDDDDILTRELFPNSNSDFLQETNNVIKARYNFVIYTAKTLTGMGIGSYKDLRIIYGLRSKLGLWRFCHSR
jgi:hypothetical protein